MTTDPPPGVTEAEIAGWLGHGSSPRANQATALRRSGQRRMRRLNTVQVIGAAGLRVLLGGICGLAAAILLVAGLVNLTRAHLGAGLFCLAIGCWIVVKLYELLWTALPERTLPDVYATPAGLHLDHPTAPAIPWHLVRAVRFAAGRQVVDLADGEVVIPADTPNASGIARCLDLLLAARAAGRLLPGEPDPREADIPATALSPASDDLDEPERGLSRAEA